eukprot:397192_1
MIDLRVLGGCFICVVIIGIFMWHSQYSHPLTYQYHVNYKLTQNRSGLQRTIDNDTDHQSIESTIGWNSTLNHYFVEMTNVALKNDEIILFGATHQDVIALQKILKQHNLWEGGGLRPFRISAQTMKKHDIESKCKSFSFIPAISVLAETHHPDNTFHLHQDLILPVMREDRYLNHVEMFAILHMTFDSIYFPFSKQFDSDNKFLCFSRFIWIQNREPAPFYHQTAPQIQFFVPQFIQRYKHFVWDLFGISDLVRTALSSKCTPEKQSNVVWMARGDTQRLSRDNTNKFINMLENDDNIHLTIFDSFAERGPRHVKEQLSSVKEKLIVLASTDTLIGAHGAGLAHSIYMNHPGMLIELMSIASADRNVIKNLFMNIAMWNQLGYYEIGTSPTSSLTDEQIMDIDQQINKNWDFECQ